MALNTWISTFSARGSVSGERASPTAQEYTSTARAEGGERGSEARPPGWAAVLLSSRRRRAPPARRGGLMMRSRLTFAVVLLVVSAVAGAAPPSLVRLERQAGVDRRPTPRRRGAGGGGDGRLFLALGEEREVLDRAVALGLPARVLASRPTAAPGCSRARARGRRSPTSGSAARWCGGRGAGRWSRSSRPTSRGARPTPLHDPAAAPAASSARGARSRPRRNTSRSSRWSRRWSAP